MRLQRFIVLVAIISILMASGCASNPPSQPSQTVSNVQISETQNQALTSTEIVRINNCGGKADSKQTAERSFSVSIEGAVGVSVGYTVLQGNVSAKYGQYRNAMKRHELTAPPGTNMEFTLKWTEQEWVGTISASGQSGKYTAHAPIQVEQVSSRDLGCGGGTGQPSPTVAPPPVPPPAPPTSNLCPDSVSRSKVQSWSIGERDVATVDDKAREFNASRRYPRGNFKAGDKIPAGVVVAIAFDGAGRRWNEFPVKPLVHRGDYGLFETLGEYIAPYEGACVSIAP